MSSLLDFLFFFPSFNQREGEEGRGKKGLLASCGVIFLWRGRGHVGQ